MQQRIFRVLYNLRLDYSVQYPNIPSPTPLSLLRSSSSHCYSSPHTSEQSPHRSIPSAAVQIPPISRFWQMISFYFDYFSNFEKSSTSLAKCLKNGEKRRNIFFGRTNWQVRPKKISLKILTILSFSFWLEQQSSVRFRNITQQRG